MVLKDLPRAVERQSAFQGLVEMIASGTHTHIPKSLCITHDQLKKWRSTLPRG